MEDTEGVRSVMKKRVTFAQSRSERPLQEHRFSLPTDSKFGASDVQFIQQRSYRRYSTPSDRRAAVHIPRSMATAPFLKHSGLTPAQREYLYGVASSHSGDRVRDIITTHYMNIVHRCIKTGHTAEKDYVYPAVLQESVEQPQTVVNPKSPASKQKGRINVAAAKKNVKSIQPKIRRQPRRLKTPTKQRKKPTTPLDPKKKQNASLPVLSPDEGEEDDDELSFKDSLSDCLSSLSLTDWDNDFLSSDSDT